MAFVEFHDVGKTYHMGEVEIQALHDVSFSVEKGELVVIVGPSGAGKTTLLNILGGMDTLSEGTVLLDGKEVSKLNKKQLTAYRRNDVGFVFQFYNLGLGHRLKNFPSQLSGGEQQRVAIARALAKDPKLLLCDEPTGALDQVTGKAILKLLQDTARKTGMTVIIITHNSALTAMADRVIRVKNGTVSSVAVNESPVDVAEIEW